MFDLKAKLFLIVSILILGGAATANAQLHGGSVIKADIPNSFVVSGKTFPAGTYTIERMPGISDPSSLLVLRGEGSNAMIFDTVTSSTTGVATATGLVFENVGGVEYLSKILVKGDDSVIEIPKKRTEVNSLARNTTDQTVTVVQNPGF